MADLVPARAELIDLLVATRGWEYRAVEAAILRGQQQQWSWRRIMTGLVGLAADPEGVPDEFAPAPRAVRPAPPERVHELAEQARARLENQGMAGAASPGMARPGAVARGTAGSGEVGPGTAGMARKKNTPPGMGRAARTKGIRNGEQ